MAQTDLDQAIDRINNTPGLSSEEKKRLRQEARDRANANGDMGAGDRRWLNSALNTVPSQNPGNGGGGGGNGGGGGGGGGNGGGGGGGGGNSGGGSATTQSCDAVKGAAPTGYKWQGSYVTNADGSISDTCTLVPDGSGSQACEAVKGAAPQGFKWQGSYVTNADGSISDTCTLVKDDSTTEDPMEGQRQNAKQFMRTIMEQLGFSTNFGFTQAEIDTLFGKMDEWIMAGYADYDRTGDTLLLLFRTDKSTSGVYNKRFPGMSALSARGQAISEREYIQLEKQYRTVLSSANLPPKYYDSFDDYGRFIAGDVSAAEVQDRVTAVQAAANPSVMKELQQYYGIDSGSATAYLLGLTDEKGLMLDAATAARNQQTIRDISRNIQIGGYAEAAGFGMDLAASSALSGTAIGQTVDPFNQATAANLQGTFAQARRNANRETTLAAIDQQAYTEQDTLLAAFGDDKKKLASEKRAARERARFGGSSGVGGTSLGVARNL